MLQSRQNPHPFNVLLNICWLTVAMFCDSLNKNQNQIYTDLYNQQSLNQTMDSYAHIASAANLVQHNPRPRQSLIALESYDILYQVDGDAYNHQLFKTTLASIVWMGVLSSCLLIMIVDSVYSSDSKEQFPRYRWLLPLISATVVAITMVVVSVCSAQQLSSMQICTTGLIAAYMVGAVMFYWTQLNHQWILATCMGSCEVGVAAIFLKDKRQIIFFILALFEILLIALKIDNEIRFSWFFVLLLPIITSVLLVCWFIGLLAVGIKYRCENPNNLMMFMGLLYKAFWKLSIAFSLGLVCLMALVLDNAFVLALSLLMFHAALITVFIFFFNRQVALYLSNSHFLAIVQKSLRVEFQKIDQQHIFYKLSEHWLSLAKPCTHAALEPEEAAPGAEGLKEDQLTRECAICLNDPSCFVWMPCGHLTVCETCAQYLRNHKKIQCIICKRECSEIYHLNVPEDQEIGQQSKSDYFYRVVMKSQ